MVRSIFKRVRRRFLQIPESEATFAVRGFAANSQGAKEHLESVGIVFLHGYHAAIDVDDAADLKGILDQVDTEYRGFAAEGAAMATWLLDSVSLCNRDGWSRYSSFVGDAHPYVLHVGIGWAIARLPWQRRRLDNYLDRFDSLFKWLIVDGYGFHEGYFHSVRSLPPIMRRPPLNGYARRAFDQGLGRSLWFFAGADPKQIIQIINAFSTERRPDLWSGVGLACCYAGISSEAEIHLLAQGAADYVAHFCQGVTFGAEARARGGILTSNADLVCQVACGMSAVEAARVTLKARNRLSDSVQVGERYEFWRSEVRSMLKESALTMS